MTHGGKTFAKLRAPHVSDAHFDKWALPVSAYDEYLGALRGARIRAHQKARARERIDDLGLPAICHIEQIAHALGVHPETVRRRCVRGAIRGAYLEGGRWCLRREHLLAYARVLAA